MRLAVPPRRRARYRANASAWAPRGLDVTMPQTQPVGYDATEDIEDIDRRLNALQQFLSAAKAPR